MVWNVLTLGAMVTCGLLAAWQWSRAGSAMGSALNVGYGLQWPVFAVFFGVMWWRMLRMEARGPAEALVPEPAPRPAPAGDSPFTARPRIPVPVLTPDENPQLTEYNRLLRRLAEQDGGK